MDFLDNKFIGENEHCKFYYNSMCESLENHCVCWFNDLPPLENYKVFITEDKNEGTKHYVLFNESGEPIKERTGIDSMAIDIEMLRFLKKVN